MAQWMGESKKLNSQLYNSVFTENYFKFTDDTALYASNSDKKVQWLIMCECGVEIALIPDLTEMGRAIQAHALEHMQLR